MINDDVGILLVVSPTARGIKEALRVKIGMKKLGMDIRGAVLNGEPDTAMPIHTIEDMLRLEVFQPPQQAN